MPVLILQAGVSISLLVAALSFIDGTTIPILMRDIQGWLFVIVFFLSLTQILLVTYRLQTLMQAVNFRVGFLSLLVKNSISLVANLLFINVISGIVARNIAIARSREDVRQLTLISIYEKLMVFVVLALFSIPGIFVLLIESSHQRDLRFATWTVSLVVQSIMLFFIIYITVKPYALRHIVGPRFRELVGEDWKTFVQPRIFTRSVGISIVSHLLLLSAYVVSALALQIDLPLIVLTAVACVVSLVASFPVSIGGWGVREVTSVFLIGVVGGTAEQAVSMSVCVGLISLVSAGTCIVGGAFCSLFKKPPSEIEVA